jgi:DNA-binding response OmpR family regulator
MILIVEDDEAIRECLQEVVGDWYPVDVAQHGREALEKIKAHPGQYQLLLLDLVMPVMDGRELLQELRRLNLTMPTLIISAARREDLGVPWLPKPFDLDLLQEAIEACVRPKPAPLYTEHGDTTLAEPGPEAGL